MAKRFTDTGKWDDPWFAELSTEHKLFWIYLLDRCDIAGGWKVNLKMAQFCLGFEIDADKFLAEAGEDRIEVLKDGNIWFLNKFIIFQYGNLTVANKIYRSVNNCLSLLGFPKGHLSPSDGGKDKDKDMVKDKDKEESARETKSEPRLWRPEPLRECQNCKHTFKESKYEAHLINNCRKVTSSY